ncbi:NAD(+) diphosphatase [Uliginosibacterium paludis]|uniref:NAD(+) diphosphatase n=1 Tax=Uliginosibacterium paludis TaxID=1615952 RepID=A0ABV2CR78_9RHOO
MWPENFIPLFQATPAASVAGHEFAFADDALILNHDGSLPDTATLEALGPARADFLFGRAGESGCRARRWDAPALPEKLQALNLRACHGVLQEGQWFLAARAKQLLGWDLASRHCGACGTPTGTAPGEPAKLCPACGHRHYPQIAPAVMCLVRRGDRLLLARSPHFAPGMFSALAGFVEAGESVEGCLHREVFEETGIRITNLRWFASQPWPFPQSLMLAFHADYAGGHITPQADEIEAADWFGVDALPGLPSPVSIASRLISDGIERIRKGLP